VLAYLHGLAAAYRGNDIAKLGCELLSVFTTFTRPDLHDDSLTLSAMFHIGQYSAGYTGSTNM
jgi:hypothetical protein